MEEICISERLLYVQAVVFEHSLGEVKNKAHMTYTQGYPTNMNHWPDIVVLKLGQSRRQWTNTNPALGQ